MLIRMPTGSGAREDLSAVLSSLTGRKLALEELLSAVEMSRSTYYDRQAKGRLTGTDTLLTAARNLGLNPVDLLVRFGHIADHDVTQYVEASSAPRADGRGAGRKVTDLAPRPDAAPL
jgi:hypothetical protein